MDDTLKRYRESLQQGHLAQMQGRPKDALRHYGAAADVAGDRALPHVSMGATYLRLGKTKEALTAYEKAVERAPDDPEVLAGHAAALLAAGRKKEAAQQLARVAELERGARTERLRPLEDRFALARAEQLHLAAEDAVLTGDKPAALEALLAESRTHAAAGHLDAALDACQRALTVASGDVRVHLEMAALYFVRGWSDRAVERLMLLNRLLELEPDDDVRRGLAELAAQHIGADSRLRTIAATGP